jgi:hypothetical protein
MLLAVISSSRPRLRSVPCVAALWVTALACSLAEEAPETHAQPVSAALPETHARPQDDDLPALDAIVQRLNGERWRIATPDAVAAARRQYDPPPSPLVRRDDAAERQIRAAIEELTTIVDASRPIATSLQPVLDRSHAITIVVDDEPDALLRYDILHDTLKVPRCAVAYPRNLLATALAHELVHAGDHAVIARRLELDRAAEALMLDLVGVEAFARERAVLEERACRIELRVARALGVAIRRPTRPPRRVPGCLMTHEHLLHALAAFEAAEAGPPGAWARLLEAGPGAPVAPR